MKKAVLIVLPIIVYFGLGWLANYIYFSINEITPNTTMDQIYDGQIAATFFLMVIYNSIFEMIHENKYSFVLSFPIPLVIAAIFAIAPMSTGASVCYSILNIATMIAGGFNSLRR